MRFRADLKPFFDASAAAKSVAPSRTTIPILSHVKIAARDGRVQITACDLDREIAIAFGAKVDAPGETTVNTATLHDALRVAPKTAEVDFALDAPRGVVLRTGKPRYVLPTLPAEDFPALSDFGAFGPPIGLDGKTFAAELDAVAHAISTEETRYYLNGVCFDVVGEKLRLVATDGHRLMRIDLDAQAAPARVIAPRDSVRIFAKVAATVDRVELELSDRMARLTAGATQIVSKLIDGTFPDYGRITPEAFQHRATLDAEAFREAVTRAALACGDKGRGVALDFAPGRLSVEGRNPDGGEAVDEVEAEGEATIRIGFNARYLGEELSALGGERIAVEMNEAGGPAKLTRTDKTDRHIVLMPLRI